MVTIIDQIKYLPKQRNVIIDENIIYNMAAREMVERIKLKINEVNISDDAVTLTVTGAVSKKDNIKFEASLQCEDAELKSKIYKAIHE